MDKLRDEILQISHVNIQFGNFKAIKDVSTKIYKNEIRFFIGPNGAGKTTILDAICGRSQVKSGKIIYQKQYDLTKMKEFKIAKLGIGRKFQTPSVFNGLTVRENIELVASQRYSLFSTTFTRLTKEQQEYVDYILQFIGLADQQTFYPKKLSHGQKQWLEIAMIMASHPKLILLDEPVAGMGRHETEKTEALILKMKNECSLIVVEHDMEFAKHISDYVTVFFDGHVLDEGTIDEVERNPDVIKVYLGRGTDEND
ncbi:MAG: urea ABC transporter ATP-binding protein UrtD [Sporolactobacillus sp.]|jgi:urea transport system ATP-binding protein|nr:urea ABC transporter ATP-binding protein UrtD [Sporolactobacillus sp.]MCI1880741.1 urea ABC transporter ATP-binding protein UrtD [Sporolactobacillus sp.]